MKTAFFSMIQEAGQVAQDSLSASGATSGQPVSTAYDSLWTGSDIPTQTPSGLDQIMLSNEKIFVVLAVVLIIWVGVVILLLRTDRHLSKVERSVAENIGIEDDEL